MSNRTQFNYLNIGTSIKKRIIAGLGANAFGQVVNIAIQILSVPVFLYFWNVETYGKWIMLSAVPIYFSMADLGVVSVASNNMTILSAQGNYASANRVFQSALFMTVIMTAIILLVTLPIILIFGEKYIGDITNRHALVLLVLLTLINIFSGMFDAVFRANNAYASGVYMLSFARLTEAIFGIAMVAQGMDFVGVAAGFVLGRLIAFVCMFIYASKTYTKFEWGFKHASRDEIEKMLKPSLAFMAFPVGNAISIQGMTITVGMVLGPVSLVLFNTYRTFSRALVQLITVLNHSVWPEISRLYGMRQYESVRALLRRGTIVSGIVSVVVGISILYFSEWVLLRWTHGKVNYIQSLFVIFIISTMMTSLWQLAMVVTKATNTHEIMSFFYLASSVLVVIFTLAFGQYLGDYTPALALLLFELIMICVSHKIANRILNNAIIMRDI